MKVAVWLLVAVGLWLGSLSFAGERLKPEPMTFTEAWAACLRQGLTLPELAQLKEIEPQVGAQLSRIEAAEGNFLWTLSKNANPEFPRTGFSLGQRNAVMAKASDRGFALCVQPVEGKESTDSYYARLMAVQLHRANEREPSSDLKTLQKRFEHSFLILSDDAREAAVTSLSKN